MSIIEPEGKAVNRSFRLDKAWDDALVEIAEERNVSLSSLLEKISKDYILFYQWVERLGSIIFSPNTVLEIVNVLEEDQLREIAEKVAQSTFKESYLARGDSLDLDTVRFQIIDQMARYANWFTVVEHESDIHYLYIKHKYGEKWSCFVETYLSSLFRDIAKIEIETEHVGQNILVKLKTY
ncbi:MAG: hypothetical protein ACLFVP_08280 [Candidatus Bathyarchaeia archaeon]